MPSGPAAAEMQGSDSLSGGGASEGRGGAVGGERDECNRIGVLSVF